MSNFRKLKEYWTQKTQEDDTEEGRSPRNRAQTLPCVSPALERIEPADNVVILRPQVPTHRPAFSLLGLFKAADKIDKRTAMKAQITRISVAPNSGNEENTPMSSLDVCAPMRDTVKDISERQSRATIHENKEDLHIKKRPVRTKSAPSLNSKIEKRKKRPSVSNEVNVHGGMVQMRDTNIQIKSRGSVGKVSTMISKFENYDANDREEEGISEGEESLTDEDYEDESGEEHIDQDEVLTPEVKKQRKILMVAKEILSSEQVYVDILKMITVDFKEFVERKSKDAKKEIITQEKFDKIFSNIPQILMFNTSLLSEFRDRIDNWDSKQKIADILVKNGPFLKLYAKYLNEFDAATSLLQETCKSNSRFGKAVTEFETLPVCGNLRLKMHMLKPIQRLPQYKLLLGDYLKPQTEDCVDYADTIKALEIVSAAAKTANDSMKAGEALQKMLKLQERVGDFELIMPGRELLKEGELMKINRDGAEPRYFILLSDCLLYTHSGVSGKLKVDYRLQLGKIRLAVPSNHEFQEEFSIITSLRSFTVRASSMAVRNEWLEAINNAIEDFKTKINTFSDDPEEEEENGSNQRHSRMENIGDEAPVWVPDERVAFCQDADCAAEFRFTKRRHHCRGCGAVMCSTCVSNKAPLKYNDFQIEKVCNKCFGSLKKKYADMPEQRNQFKGRMSSSRRKKKNDEFIDKKPSVLQEDASTEKAQMSGFLQTKKGRAWKRNWYVLKDHVLFTFKATNDKMAIETMPVLGWALDIRANKFEIVDGQPATRVFTLSHPGLKQNHVFCAEADDVAVKWTEALKEAIKLQDKPSHV